MPNRKIDDLLSAGHRRFTTLQRLLHRAEGQNASTAEVRALLPDGLQKECRVVQVAPPNITIACRSAAAATRVRFLAPELIQSLRTLPQYGHITKVNVRVVETGE